MANTYSVYCDESSHLENDGQNAMVLGAVWCESESRHEVVERINEIKAKHGLPTSFEIKWTKVSPSKIDFYLDVINYFFDNDDLHFRGLIIPNKAELDHEKFNHTHDDWYYKMYFVLLKAILDNASFYKVFLDIKDTNGGAKIKSLQDVLSNQMYDFDRRVIKQIQLVRSHEVLVLQVCDLLIGALMAENRDTEVSAAKQQIIDKIKHRSGYSLRKRTLYTEKKFNLFVWHGQSDEAI